MTNNKPISLPVPAFLGGTKAITTTPVAGKQRAAFAPRPVPPPDWWAEAVIKVDEI
jgi:hypothetical protein